MVLRKSIGALVHSIRFHKATPKHALPSNHVEANNRYRVDEALAESGIDLHAKRTLELQLKWQYFEIVAPDPLRPSLGILMQPADSLASGF